MPLSADRTGALPHAAEPESFAGVQLRMLFHPNTIVRDSQLPIGVGVGHGDMYITRPAVAHGVADRFLGNSQQLMLVFRLEPRCNAAAFESTGDASGNGGALRQLAQGDFQPGAASLIQSQGHHGTPCLGEAITRQIADTDKNGVQLGVLALARWELFGRAKLHQDSGEGLRQAVMYFLADARALDQNGGFLGGVREPCELNGESCLLSKSYEQLTALHVLGVPAETQNEETNITAAKYKWIDDYAGVALAAVERERAGPDVRRVLVKTEVLRFLPVSPHV